MHSLELSTPPSVEPVSLQDLKEHLRLNTTDEDDLLSGYLITARQLFEAITGRQLSPATYKLYLDAWPCGGVIRLPKPPLKTFTSLKYRDTNGTEQTAVSGTDYVLYAKKEPAQIWLLRSPGLSTTVTPQITVEYQAGATSTPQLIKTGILLLAAHFFANREATTEKNLKHLPMGFQAICSQYLTGIVDDYGHGGW